MVDHLKFYIDGAWQAPATKKTLPVVNPATEEAMYEVALGSAADVDKAVAAARARVRDLLAARRARSASRCSSEIIEVYKTRMKDIGAAISDEMGAPLWLRGAAPGRRRPRPPHDRRSRCSRTIRSRSGCGTTMIVREPVGVVRHDHAVELAAQPDRLQGRAGAGRRLHDGAEAVRGSRRRPR